MSAHGIEPPEKMIFEDYHTISGILNTTDTLRKQQFSLRFRHCRATIRISEI